MQIRHGMGCDELQDGGVACVKKRMPRCTSNLLALADCGMLVKISILSGIMYIWGAIIMKLEHKSAILNCFTGSSFRFCCYPFGGTVGLQAR